MAAADAGFEGMLYGVWFAHPWLIGAGAAAMLVPWAIHWFSRRRVRTVEWAAMRLLIGAQQRDASRVRLEDRALLTLRMSWLLLAGLLAARPYWDEGAGATSEPTEFIVVLDDSRSMHAVGPDGTAFARAQLRLVQWIEARSELGRDRLTVRLASSPESAVLDRTPLTAARRASAIKVIEQLEAGEVRVDWAQALEAVRRVEQRASDVRRVVFVVSDFRSSDWSTLTSSAPTDSATELEGVAWTACDVGASRFENLSLESLEADGIAADGVPVTYRAQVRNWGERVADEVTVELRVGETAPRSAAVDSIPAGGTATVEFPVTLVESADAATSSGIVVESRLVREGGLHRDGLPSDDVMLSVAPGGEGVGVYFVEDEQRPAATQRSASALLARALAPDPAARSGFRILSGPLDDWEAWREARVIVATGEESWSDVAMQRIGAWLRAGGALVLCPSVGADAAAWNARWAEGEESLSPVSLRELRGDPERRHWTEIGDWSQGWSAARWMRELTSLDTSRVKVFQWWASQPSGSAAPKATSSIGDAERARVLGRLADAESTPLLVERAHGRGLCWWSAVPLDESASAWPLDPAFVIFWQEALRDAMERGEPVRRAEAGKSLEWEAPIAEVRRQASLTTPGNDRWSVSGEASADAPEVWKYTSPSTRRSGVYTWMTTTVEGRPLARAVAVNGAVGESDLRPLSAADASGSLMRDWRRLAGDRPWADQWSTAGDGWTWLIWLAMIVLGVEQAFAWRIGRRRG